MPGKALNRLAESSEIRALQHETRLINTLTIVPDSKEVLMTDTVNRANHTIRTSKQGRQIFGLALCTATENHELPSGSFD